ncbi:FAD-dependent oxidoreductase [Halapricum hydrolyticum]|uniref:FAD-dependent oxidoreductase n=1 Tax=Halapricum hydrolyticum TaxID=2979991 RepID=A0AAE3LG96_9EURY|nr:FAD-dependent oxidoreductase [Halapricum hydrolyticum]MCU4719643.1 FAD-dependent oxidoreductase [Halapricum hydrolyticum]MCU4728565.1 FAD-dependent oxidoreductase [Halapricum hydrolyticum]
MTEHRDVAVIGAGQAGLATSYYLTEAGCDHVVLERDRAGERWRSEKWDSFTLVTPNVMSRFPGFSYEGDESDGLLTCDEVAEYLETYVDRFDPPFMTGVEVLAVRKHDAADTVETTDTIHETTNVIVATGPFQRLRIPEFGAEFSSCSNPRRRRF